MTGPASTDAVLMALGARVKGLRTAKGMSRQALSAASNVSPRYLAQLEAGAGNISVALLHRVSLALGAPMSDLFTAPTEDGKAHRICLIGLRGAGKSTLGAAVSRRLGVPFVELSDEITARAGIPASEVIALYGAEGYRRLEAEALAEVTQSHEAVILAVAGGIVEDAASFDSLMARYHTVWLQAAPEDHMDRVRAQGDLRPMQGSPSAMEELRAILEQRSALYAKADLRFQTSGQSASEASEALAGTLRPLLG